MAFLCPSRLGRRKQKKDNFYDINDKPPTINDTDRQSERLIVLQNFTSDDPDELSVKQGQKVTFVFREGDWAYVVTAEGKEGFVPFIYCAQLGQSPLTSTPSPLKEKHDYTQSAVFQPQQKNLPQTTFNNTVNRKLDSFSSNKAYGSDDNISVCSEFSESPSYDTPDDVQAYLKAAPWIKRPNFLDLVAKPGTTNGHICSANPAEKCGDASNSTTASPNKESPSDQNGTTFELYRVLYNYEGSGSDDICVTADDIVCAMDGDDMFLWVQKEDQTMGYIPKYYLQKIEPDDLSPRSVSEASDTSPGFSNDKRSNNNKYTPSTQRTPSANHSPCVNTPIDTRMTETSTKDTQASKYIPAKPPRLKKQKHNSQIERDDQIYRQVSKVSESDWDTLSEQTADTDTEDTESLTESMKVSIIQKELEKLVPLHHRESVTTYTSASSYDEDVFDNSVHQQLDHLRPQSTHKMYKYQREKADYYDEYFYDDSKLDIKDNKNDLINVAEILEIRDALPRIKSDETRASGKSKVLPHSNISTNLKQYMLNLPTTVLGYGGMATQTNLKTTKGTRRYYVSQVEDDESVLYSKPNKVKPKDNLQPVTNISQATTTTTTTTASAKEDNKQSTPTSITLKKRDWSFGYPRKAKPTNYSQEKINDVQKERKLSDNSNESNPFEDNAYNEQDYEMQELLEKTGGLLNQSKDLLTKKPKYRTANPPKNKVDTGKLVPGRNIELTDPTEKCNHYLTNLIINKDNNSIQKQTKTDQENESDSENIISDVSEQPSYTLKTSLDENDNVKLCHGINDVHIDIKRQNDCSLQACDDVRGITEFVVQYDYTPDSELAIPVARGEVLHIGLDQQEDTEWYWAYSPRLRAYGYVPRLYVRIPLVTII